MNIPSIISSVSGLNYKLIAIVIATATLIGFGAAAVLTYRSAILENERLSIQNKSLIELAEKQRINVLKLKAYDKKLSDLQTKYREKERWIISKRSTRDESGNIVPNNDSILRELNGMFSKEDRDGSNNFADYSTVR